MRLAALLVALAACGCPGNAPTPRGDAPRPFDAPVTPTFDGRKPPADVRPADIGPQHDILVDSGTPPPPDSGSGCAGNEQGFSGKCYRVVVGVDMTYSAAKQACAQNGGAPVAIESANEDTFIYSMLPAVTQAAWIGLVRQGGGFVWDSTGTAPAYTNWASGEPNNSKGVENCVVVWGPALSTASLRSKWNDAPCDTTPRDTVVCER